MSKSQPQRNPGWYPDPSGEPGQMYWDGRAWCATAPKPASSPWTAILKRFGMGAAALVAVFLLRQGLHHPTAAGTIDRPNAATFATSETTAPIAHPSAPLGSSLAISFEDGSQASFLVEPYNHPVNMTSDQIKGAMYGFRVTVTGLAGTVEVNPLYFSVRTSTGTSVQYEVSAFDNTLPMGQVLPGQKLSGPLGFDVPRGELPAALVLEGPLGEQLGIWHMGG